MTLQLLPCPACERVTALTVEVSPSTRLRCPHCGGEFSFSTLFREPRDVQWQIVRSELGSDMPVGSKTIDDKPESATARTLNRDEGTKTLVDHLGQYEGLGLEPDDKRPDDGEDFELEPLDTSSANDSKQGDLPVEGDTLSPASEALALAKKTDWSNLQPSLGEPVGRRKRKQSSSPLWSILQVALGGLAAIPIALLLVWHVIGTDVADAGPWVGKYAPWIVPEKFRPYQSLTTVEPRRPTPPGSGLPSVPDMSVASTPVDHSAVAEVVAEVFDESVDESVDEKANDPVSGKRPTEIERNAPLLDNAFAMIRQANEHLDDWSKAMREGGIDLKSLSQATYSDLTNLAIVIDKLPQQNLVLRPVRSRLGKSLGTQVTESPEVQRLIVEESRSWVKVKTLQSTAAQKGEANIQGYGLAMIFIVEQAEQVTDAQGHWWRVVATNNSRLGDPALEVRIPNDVAQSLTSDQIAAKQMIFLLGVVRPQDEQKDGSESDSAPNGPVVVASYVMEL